MKEDAIQFNGNNFVNTAFSELYHANGSAGGYDKFNRLTAFSRGALSDTNSDGMQDTVATSSRLLRRRQGIGDVLPSCQGARSR